MRSKPSVAIVGAGSLAQALASLLPNAGFKVREVVIRADSKRSRTAKVIAKKVGAKLSSMETASWDSDVVWLAVADRSIRGCSEALASRTNWKGRVVFHSSGALSSDELKPLKRAGASVASLHPMMTFVPDKVPTMAGVGWVVEGDKNAVMTGKKLVRAMGGEAFTIRKDRKPLYHAFGAFLSPLLVVLLERAATIGRAAGFSRAELARLMRPITAETLRNVFLNPEDPGKAFSGPLVRGDTATIARHLKSLAKWPEANALYRALLQSAIKSKLPINNRSAIKKLLL